MDQDRAITAIFSRTSRLYRMRLNATLTEENIDLSSEMCGMLIELGKEEGKTQQELGQILFKDKGGVTKILKSLAKRGLIYAKEGTSDKRYKNIFLTHEGKKVLSKVQPIVQELRAFTLKNIDKNDINLTREVLKKMIHNLTSDF